MICRYCGYNGCKSIEDQEQCNKKYDYMITYALKDVCDLLGIKGLDDQ